MVILLRLAIPFFLIVMILGFFLYFIAQKAKENKELKEKKYAEEIKEREELARKFNEK